MASRYPKWLSWSFTAVLLLIAFVGVRVWQHQDLAEGTILPLEARDLTGHWRSSRDFHGRPLLLHFWATWCAICRLEERGIASIAQDWPVIAVAIQSGSSNTVRTYLEEKDLNLTVVNDEYGTLASQYGIKGVPTSFVLDPEGRIRFTEVGYTTSLGLRLRLWWAGRFYNNKS